MTPREETARIIMPQSGVGATPHKGLITEKERQSLENYYKYEIKYGVSPSTGITFS